MQRNGFAFGFFENYVRGLLENKSYENFNGIFERFAHGVSRVRKFENGALGFTSDHPDICGEILDKIGARKLKR